MPRTKEQILAEIRLVKTNPDNYIESVIRADPYTLVAERMVEKVPHSAVFEGMTFKEIRAYCKDPVMTAMYNSKQEPIKAFGEDSEELSAFYDTLYELFPGAINVLEAINNQWDNKALFHTWEAPDGHVAHVQVTEHIEGTLDNEGLKLPYRYEKNMPSNVRTSLSPNFTHTNDGFCVRHIVETATFLVAHVHDDIQAHPNHMGKVREYYLDGICEVAESRVLEKFCGQDFGIDLTAFKEGLKTSSYALC